MKNKRIKLRQPQDCLKETREDRLERIKYINAMTTRVVDKDKRKRKRIKKEDIRNFDFD